MQPSCCHPRPCGSRLKSQLLTLLGVALAVVGVWEVNFFDLLSLSVVREPLALILFFFHFYFFSAVVLGVVPASCTITVKEIPV